MLSKKKLLNLSLAFIISLAMIQTVHASTNAFDDGYKDGRTDFLDGYEKNSYCNPDNSDSNPDAYCTWYKGGYEAGWVAASVLYGQQ